MKTWQVRSRFGSQFVHLLRSLTHCKMEKQIAFQLKNAAKMCGYVLQDEIMEIEFGALVWVNDEKRWVSVYLVPETIPLPIGERTVATLARS